jgi:hypothetical protein
MIIRSLSRAPRSRPRAARLRAPDPGAGPGNRPPDGGVACPGSLELRRFMRNPGCSTGVRLVRMRPRIGQPVPVRRAAAQLAALLPGLRGHRGADPGAGWLPGTGCRAANLASTATGRYRVSPSSWPDFARNAEYCRLTPRAPQDAPSRRSSGSVPSSHRTVSCKGAFIAHENVGRAGSGIEPQDGGGRAGFPQRRGTQRCAHPDYAVFSQALGPDGKLLMPERPALPGSRRCSPRW